MPSDSVFCHPISSPSPPSSPFSFPPSQPHLPFSHSSPLSLFFLFFIFFPSDLLPFFFHGRARVGVACSQCCSSESAMPIDVYSFIIIMFSSVRNRSTRICLGLPGALTDYYRPLPFLLSIHIFALSSSVTFSVCFLV